MSALPVWADLAISALLVVGAVFTLVGSWGLAKLGTFLTRVHGPSKATTLGVGCLLLASMLWFGVRGSWSLHELLVGTDSIKRLIQEKARVATILAEALNSGMRTLKMDGMEKVMMGLTDLKMVRSVCIR